LSLEAEHGTESQRGSEAEAEDEPPLPERQPQRKLSQVQNRAEGGLLSSPSKVGSFALAPAVALLLLFGGSASRSPVYAWV
jgi:hypothetical protein